MKYFVWLLALATGVAFAQSSNADKLRRSLVEQQKQVDKLQYDLDAAVGRIEREIEQITDIVTAIRDTKSSRSDALKLKKETSKALLDLIKFYQEQQTLLRRRKVTERNTQMRDLYEAQIVFGDRMIEKRVDEIIRISVSLNGYATLAESSNDGDNQISHQTARRADTQVTRVRRELDKSIAKLEQSHKDLEKKYDRSKSDKEKAALDKQMKEIAEKLDDRRRQLGSMLTGEKGSDRAVSRRSARDIAQRTRKSLRGLKASYENLIAKKQSSDSAKRKLAELAASWKKLTGKDYEKPE